MFVDSEQGINTAIRKIRRALNDDSAQPQYLQTVVGRGYRFVGVTSVDGNEGGAASAEEGLSISPEDLGRAIMAAAGLEPNDPKKE